METQENEKFVETFLSRAATSVALVVSLFLIIPPTSLSYVKQSKADNNAVKIDVSSGLFSIAWHSKLQNKQISLLWVHTLSDN